jgi:hypothetical protein
VFIDAAGGRVFYGRCAWRAREFQAFSLEFDADKSRVFCLVGVMAVPMRRLPGWPAVFMPSRAWLQDRAGAVMQEFLPFVHCGGAHLSGLGAGFGSAGSAVFLRIFPIFMVSYVSKKPRSLRVCAGPWMDAGWQ